MKALLRYQAKSYISSSKFVMPALAYFLFLAVFYSSAPRVLVPSLVISACVLYMIMIWTGFGYSDSEEMISEEIMILKAGGFGRYYVSKYIFMFIMSAILSLFSIIVPLVWMAVLKAGGVILFTSPKVAAEVQAVSAVTFLMGFLVHLLCGFMGSIVGFLFHPRIFKNRKFTVIVALLVGLMGFIRGPIATDLKAVRFIMWIFPPMSTLISGTANGEVFFPYRYTWMPLIYILVYSAVITGAGLFMVNKKGF